jgi:hypothetical protein
MHRRTHWIALLTGLATVAAATAPRAAEPDPREIEARKKCLAGDATSGVALLAELYVETRNATYIYNQARCYQQNGRPAEAIQHFREYLRKATVSPDERQSIEGFIKELEGERDRAPSLPPPGPTAAPAEAAVPPEGPVATAPPDEGPGWRRPVVWSAAALGAVALTVGVVSHVRREAKYRDFNARKAADGYPLCDRSAQLAGAPACSALLSEGQSAGRLAVVGYVGAALLGAGALLLHLTGPRPRGEAEAKLTCGPSVAEVGILCAGHF